MLLLTIPPLDLAPVAPTLDGTPPTDPSTLKHFASLFNKRLRGLIHAFPRQREHVEAKVRLFDLNAFLKRAMKRPAEFEQTKGLKETRTNCWEYNP